MCKVWPLGTITTPPTKLVMLEDLEGLRMISTLSPHLWREHCPSGDSDYSDLEQLLSDLQEQTLLVQVSRTFHCLRICL